MSTTYVDINCKNSRLENTTNNVFEYELPDALCLPAGTEINVQNALVNLQGITGASIELDEDFEETLLFQYYMSDSTYQTPNGHLKSVGTAYQIFSKMDIHSNQDIEFGEPNYGSYPGAQSPEGGTWDMGWSENIMPLTVQSVDIDNNYTTYPFCGSASIKIEKGVYSISKLVTLISDQINQRITAQDDRLSNIQVDKLNGDYNGNLVNNTMNRLVKVEDYRKADLGPTDIPPTYWEKFLNSPESEPLLGWCNFYNKVTDRHDLTNNVPYRRPLTVDDNKIIPTVVAVTCDQNERIRQQIISPDGGVDGDFSYALSWLNFVPRHVFGSGGATINTAGKYNMVFQRAYGTGKTLKEINEDELVYNLFEQGMGVGTTGFNVNYDAQRSAFSIQKAHETRRKPTHDLYGNSLANPGVGVSYVKLPCRKAQSDAGETPGGGGATPMTTNQLSTILTLIQRYSGVCIYNWAYNTCLSQGDINKKEELKLPDDDDAKLDQYCKFQEWFNNEDNAKRAWNKTLWKRLGFTYEDLQAETAFTQQKFFGNAKETSPGFTTRNQIGSSAMPFVSTLYNPLAESGTDNKPPAGGTIALPAVNGVQSFNLLNVNIPQDRFQNNTTGDILPTVAQYQSSFYTAAVMFPIETTELDVTASNLPILSDNGYLYVLSNLVEENDVVKFKDNVGLLDQLPKSNLSNQDFISDRTAIIHTLSNEKILNSIRIQILNPDLTNVDLQPNSSILVKITRPLEKPTVLLETVENNLKRAGVQAEVQAEIQKEEKEAKKQANINRTRATEAKDGDDGDGGAPATGGGLPGNTAGQREVLPLSLLGEGGQGGGPGN